MRDDAVLRRALPLGRGLGWKKKKIPTTKYHKFKRQRKIGNRYNTILLAKTAYTLCSIHSIVLMGAAVQQ